MAERDEEQGTAWMARFVDPALEPEEVARILETALRLSAIVRDQAHGLVMETEPLSVLAGLDRAAEDER